MQPDPPEIVVAAGTDREQLQALLSLSQLWALEEHGNDLIVELWAEHTRGKVSTGMWIPLIAWAGPEPVGMVEVSFFDDPGAHYRVGYGDHAFVKEEWRGFGAYRALYDAVHECGKIMGAEEGCIPVGATDEAGKFLKPMYERAGYHVGGYFMRRTL